MKRFFIDLSKALKLSIAISAGLSLLLWIGGFLFSGFIIRTGFIAVRTGLLILGALSLFVFAGANLFRQGRLLDLKEHQTEWNKRFLVFQIKTVLFIVSTVLLITASTVDYLLYYTIF